MKIIVEDIQGGKKYVWDISFYKAITKMIKHDYEFMCKFLRILREFESTTYFFECPSIKSSNVKDKKFEFVLISAHLSLKDDPQSYKQYFIEKTQSVVHFYNPSKTCLLIVPYPLSKKHNYSSLGPYIRQDMIEQYLKLFEETGHQLLRLLKESVDPIWLSTHGAGVPWLHIRLDKIPKYYSFIPYKKN